MSISPTQVAGGAERRISNEEVREILHSHIRKTAKFIKFLDVCVHLFAWVAAIFALWLVACVVDHWLTPLSSVARWLFWSLAVIGSTWWLATKLLPLLWYRINPAYAAKRIEHLLPEFKNGLISWLELDQLPENGVPRGVMAALTYRAARFIGGQDPSTTVDTSRLIKLIGIVLLLFTSLVVYTMVSPKSVMDTGRRIAMPWRALAAPSRVQILSVKPGAVELTQGKPLDVDVEVRGIRSSEAVRVRFTTTDGQLRDQKFELTAITEGYHYAGKLRTETSGVEHELDYWIEAGDAISGPYRVTLSPLPSLTLEQVELKFPAYTKIADRAVRGGDFEAVEGTRATIHALANQQMARGRLEINPEIDAAGELSRADSVHELSVDDRQLTGSLLLQLNSEKENPTKSCYRLRGYNTRGDGNREPLMHTMKVIADVAPEITLIGPESRRVKVRLNSRLNLEVRANDPDFGLSQIELEIRRSGIIVRKEILLQDEGAIGRQVKTLPLSMADFRLTEGSTIEVRAIARDNRHDPISGKLAANSKDSEPLTLEVVGPDQAADELDEQMTAPEEPAKKEGQGNQGASDKAVDHAATNAEQPNPGNSSNTDSKSNQPMAAEPERSPANQAGKQQGGQAGGEPGGQADGSKEAKRGKDSAGGAGSQQGAKSQQDTDSRQQPGTGAASENNASNSQKADSGASSSNSPASAQSSSQPTSNSASNQAPSTDKPNSAGNGSAGKNTPEQGGTVDPQASESGGKPSSDGEVVKRVQEFMKDKQSQPPTGRNQPNSAKEDDEKSDGAKSDGAKSDGAKSDGAKSDGAKSDGAKSDGAKSDGAKSDGAKSDGAKSDGAKSDGAKSDGAKSDGAKSDGAKSDGAKSDGANSDGAKADSAKSDGAKSDGAKSDGAKSDGAKGDGAKSDGAKSDGAKSDGAKSDGAKSDGAKSDGANSDGAKADSAKSGGAKSDGAKGDGAKSDGAKSDGVKSDGVKNDNAQSGASNTQKDQQSGADSGGVKAEEAGAKPNDPSNDPQGAPGQSPQGQGSKGQGSQAQGSQGQSSQGQSSQGQSSQGEDSSGKGTPGQNTQGKEANSQNSQSPENSSTESGSKSKDSNSQNAGPQGQSAQEQKSQGQKSQQPGSKGKGSQGQGSQGQGAQSQGSQGQGSQGQGSQSQPGGSSAGGGAANGSKTGQAGNSGTGTGNGTGGETGESTEANQDFASRTTQMVLDYLNRQKNQPDPALLRELNWTEDDLRKFTERWNQARDLAKSPNPADQLKWKEMLDDLGLNGQLVKPSVAGSTDDNFQQMRDSGNRVRPPQHLLKQYDAFRRAIEKSTK